MTAATRPLARPLATATAALLGAGVIAAAPMPTSAPVSLPTLQAPEIALQASIVDILGFPVYQQAIANEVEFVAIRAAGLAEGGAGLVQSLVALPAALITATEQTFSGNPLGALTTLEDWVIGTGSAALVPPVLANIEVGQIQLAIQSALLLAQPTALVQLGSGVFAAFDGITRSFIIAGQNLVDAVLSFNIGNIVQAVVGGVAGIAEGFLTGGQAIVDGIAAAQTTLVNALKSRPVVQVQPLAVEPAAAAPKSAAAQSAPSDSGAESAPAGPAPTGAEARADVAAAAEPDTAGESDAPSTSDARTGTATATHRGATAAATRTAGGRGEAAASQDGDGPAKADSKRAAAR